MSRSDGGSRGIRIKVKRADLIKAVEKKVAECDKEWEKAHKAYRLLDSQWPAKAKAEMKRWIAELDQDPEAMFNKYGEFRMSLPRRPSEPAKPEGGHRLLEMLRMGADETVSLTEEQYAEYMTACRR